MMKEKGQKQLKIPELQSVSYIVYLCFQRTLITMNSLKSTFIIIPSLCRNKFYLFIYYILRLLYILGKLESELQVLKFQGNSDKTHSYIT